MAANKKPDCKKPKAKRKRKLNGRLFEKGNKIGRKGKGVPHPNQPRTIAEVQQAFIRSTVDIDERLEELKREDNGLYIRIIAGLVTRLQDQAVPQRIEISFVSREPAAPAGGNGAGQ